MGFSILILAVKPLPESHFRTFLFSPPPTLILRAIILHPPPIPSPGPILVYFWYQ